MGEKVPLSSGFMLTSMLGLMFCILYIPDIKWAFAFGVVFFVMFVASMLSMTAD